MTPIKVFLADDHKILRQGLTALLEADHSITITGESGDGQESINSVKENPPDILILDISIPDINGVDVAEYLKKEIPELKIICLTMYDNRELLYRMYKAGASAYILKDNAADELTGTIYSVHKNEKEFIAPSYPDTIIEELKFKFENMKELTKREKEVLSILSSGKTNREISDMLELSVRTVEAHRKNIMEKINASTTAEMIKFAIQKGYVNIQT